MVAIMERKPGESAVERSGRAKKKSVGISKGTRTFRPVRSRPSWLDHPQLKLVIKKGQRRTYAELSAAVKHLTSMDLCFIASDEFSQEGAAETIFGDAEFDWFAAPGPSLSKQSDLSLMLGQICRAAVLKPQEERSLFRRFNFLRYQAEKFRSGLDPQEIQADQVSIVEEIVALAQRHKEHLVEANIRLVVSIAKKLTHDSSSLEDMVSDGICSLIRAVEKFDFSMGFRFSTFATQVIRRDLYRLMMAKKKESERYTSSFFEMEPESIEDESIALQRERRWEVLRGRLSQLLSQLDRREQLIIRSRFALGAHRKVHALQSLANRLGISKERVRQLEKRAMEKLQELAVKAGPLELDIAWA